MQKENPRISGFGRMAVRSCGLLARLPRLTGARSTLSWWVATTHLSSFTVCTSIYKSITLYNYIYILYIYVHIEIYGTNMIFSTRCSTQTWRVDPDRPGHGGQCGASTLHPGDRWSDAPAWGELCKAVSKRGETMGKLWHIWHVNVFFGGSWHQWLTHVTLCYWSCNCRRY
jgi:hypothetical protein